MYLKALAQYHADVVSDAARALRDESAPPHARIEAFLNAPLTAAESRDRSGCFLCNASADQADLDAGTQAQVRSGFDLLEAALVSALAELLPALDRKDQIARAQILLALYSGLRIIVRSGAEIAPLKTATRQAMKVLPTPPLPEPTAMIEAGSTRRGGRWFGRS